MNSRLRVTAAELGADLRAGRRDAVDVVEETLTAIAAFPDQAIFTQVTAGVRARRRGRRGPGSQPASH
jgi:hypothetical protein